MPPVFAPADVAAEPAATVATPATGVQGAAVAGSAAAAEAGPASARRWVLPVLITALAGTAAWAAWTLRGDPAPVAPPPVVAPLPPPPPPPTIDLEAAQAELERLVTERTSALGKRLADDYDEQIGELETQIVQARDQAAGDPPQLVSVPSPAYPEAAGEGRQAAVRVRVLVAADGSVRQAELAPEGGAGPAFDELAVRTARRARFQPVAGGRDRWTEVVVRFAPPGP